ncbi:Probable myosin-binding protein 6 [Striga hermonthica]|uniref:Probable myosin-binding protein 6 n=1 Tax=Striga hermonthica TaxID=68872 RepID=A0A9N7RL80_STRHE|nr:Probable myosin-binding protein 6 [Striga hermonthica]
MPVGPIKTFLVRAALEWAMTTLLSAEGLLSLAARELARRFELQAPCPLCTRTDRYNESLCGAHKRDISSLAYCHAHDRLSDVRTMCRSCFLSDKDSSDCDKYKSLVGVLQKDSSREEERDDPKSGVKEGIIPPNTAVAAADSTTTKCSCCGEIRRARPSPLNCVGRRSMMSEKASCLSPQAAGRNDKWCGFESPRFRCSARNDSPRIKCSKGESPRIRFSEGDSSNVVDTQDKEDVIKATTTLIPPDSKDTNDDTNRTPKLTRANKLLALPLKSAPVSPIWVKRGVRKLTTDKEDEPNDRGPLTDVETDISNRMRRQVCLDHSSLMELYMELDEERNASNVAANNAMAMITRLQAEKAAVQMEALQYQRMMEEQAEYDEEALQAMQDSLEQKDDDINALMAKLELYEEKFGVIEDDEDYQEMKSQSFVSFSENSASGSLNGGDSNESERAHNENRVENRGENEEMLSFDFEGERLFLFGLLTDLEKKLYANEERNSSEADNIKNEDEAGNNDKATLTREVSSIKERLRDIETDSCFLKHAAMALQKGDKGTKLLSEIAQNLRKIRQSMRSSSDRNTVA